MGTLILHGTAQQRALLVEAVDSFTRKLIPDSVDLEISIELIRNLYKKEEVKADMYVVDDDEEIPNEFEIRLDSSLNNIALLRALAHEMVHVKQYVYGELKDVSLKTALWKGQKHVMNGHTYWDQPWEIEAYGREIGLVENFIRYRRYQKKSWNRDYDYA